MEKLQFALAKARAERTTNTSSRAAAQAEKPDTAATSQDVMPPTPATAAAAQAARVEPVSQEVEAGLAEAWKALPALSLKPKTLKRHCLVAAETGREAVGIDMMRTRVLQQMRDNGWRRLAITSPTASCGKSTIALNLAMSLQRQPDLRTVVMEMDLRRPSVSKILGIERDLSFAHVLKGTQSFADNAVRCGANLAISSNQRPWRDAAELLGARHVPQALRQIEQDYAPNVMLFDTPPMLVTDDMMAFARHVDCVLLVAGAESTTVKEIDICEEDLASQTNVMGVVLNKCRYMGPQYGHGYYE